MSTYSGLWVNASKGQTLPGAVVGGREANGEFLYVARGLVPGTPFRLVGKLVPSHKHAYITWKGKEIGLENYQVLILGGPHNWVPSEGSNIPNGALVGGQASDLEDVYIGRVHHDGLLTPGTVLRSGKVCYIPYNGEELRSSSYEVLVPS